MNRRRGRGDGSIRERPNGLWEGSLRYRDPITDLNERTSFYGKSRSEVVEKLDKARARLRSRKVPKDEKAILSRFLTAWLEDVVKPSKSPATYRQYKIIVDEHLAKSKLAPIPLRALKEVQIHHVLLARKVPSRTAQLCVVVLKLALEQAVKWGFLEVNPAARMVTPRIARKELRALSADEARAFLAAAKGTPYYALYYLAIDTGMRQGELLALEWRDIDLEAGTLRVVRSLDNHTGEVGPVKTRASRRQIALGARTVAVLKAMPRSKSLVFRNARGGYLSPQNIRNRSFLPLQLEAKIDPPIRFHDLRHTAATLMLQAGIHPKIVSERLGHATIAITMDTYQHVSPTMQRDVAGRVSELLKPKKGGTVGGTAKKRAEKKVSRETKKPR